MSDLPDEDKWVILLVTQTGLAETQAEIAEKIIPLIGERYGGSGGVFYQAGDLVLTWGTRYGPAPIELIHYPTIQRLLLKCQSFLGERRTCRKGMRNVGMHSFDYRNLSDE